jgi:DNA-binding XRE family transcriptional regulator
MNTNMKQSKGALRWKFKKVMDELDIGTLELASFMGVDKRTICEWRKAIYFPKITEIRWLQICEVLNEISRIRGREVKIMPLDLIEFCPNEIRDFDVFDYQYASGDARKKPDSSGEKKSAGNGKNKVAA